VRRVHSTTENKRHPWMGHFSGAYPPDAQERIAAVKSLVDAPTK